MQDQLTNCQTATHELTEQGTEPLPPLCEESFVSDDFTGAHAGLPNDSLLIRKGKDAPLID